MAVAAQESHQPWARVEVEATFVPDSEQELLLTWKNVQQIELAVYAVDLMDEARSPFGLNGWMLSERLPIVHCLTYDTHTVRGEAGKAIVTLEPRLPPGAYFVSGTARGSDGVRWHAGGGVLLVSDVHIGVQTTAKAAKIFVSNVETGEPIPNARVRITTIQYTTVSTIFTQTAADGTLDMERPPKWSGTIMIAASAGSRQAYRTYHYGSYPETDAAKDWKVHGFTDRPAYRAGETVRWKIVARTGIEERWETPAGRTVEYSISGPTGARSVLAQGTATLNAFGSFWGEVVLPPHMPPGSYSIRCLENGKFAGGSPLFELEEPPPPTALSLKIVTAEGCRYVPGDRIEAFIEVRDGAGQPVAGALVEATVHDRPFAIASRAREYPSGFGRWIVPQRDYYDDQNFVKAETLRTDANGRAILGIDTFAAAKGLTYHVEARIEDAAGVEVRAGKTLNIARDAYGVVLELKRTLLGLNERAQVRFRVSDADGEPVATAGEVNVLRRRGTDWAFTDEKVLEAKVVSGAKGEAAFTFTPKRAGYYIIRWMRLDAAGAGANDRVMAEAAIWVVGPATTDLGYVPERELQIHLDRGTPRAGESLSVLLTSRSPGRWVWLTSAVESLLDLRLLHLEGTVKLVQLALDERYVPSFTFTASSVYQRELSSATNDIRVNPVERVLAVEVKPDRAEYAPGEEVTLTVTTRDHAGKPIAAEVALAVTDEAVTATREYHPLEFRHIFYNKLPPTYVGNWLSTRMWPKYVRRTAEEARDAAAAAQSVVAIPPPAAPSDPGPPREPDEPPPPYQGIFQVSMDELLSDSRSTALWTPGLVTGANGTTTIRFTLPDLRTIWRVRVRAVTAGAAFADAVAYVRSDTRP